MPKAPVRKTDPFQAGIGVISAWIVALLALLALLFVGDRVRHNALLTAGWFVLVAVAVLRAIYRTYLFRKHSRTG